MEAEHPLPIPTPQQLLADEKGQEQSMIWRAKPNLSPQKKSLPFLLLRPILKFYPWLSPYRGQGNDPLLRELEGGGGASYSNPLSLGWQHTFTRGNGLIPLDSHLQTWRKGEAVHLVDSLGRALLLPDDLHFWEEFKDEYFALNLKWHSIVVSTTPPLYDYFCG